MLPRNISLCFSISIALGASCLGLLAGCSGGSGGSNPAPLPTSSPLSPTPSPKPQTKPRFPIQWAQRSRVTNAPASALSGEVTLIGAQLDGSDAIATFNRDTNQRNPYTATYQFSRSVYAGSYTLRARFFADTNSRGALVAQATVPVTIQGDGSGIANIVLSGDVAQVTFPDQDIMYPGLKDLQYVAADAQGNVLAVSPGSVFYRIQSGAEFVRFTSEQYAEGTAPGIASIIASIDGRDSLPGQLRVLAPAVVTISPNGQVIALNSELRFSATVSSIPDTSVSWRMKQENTGTIDVNGVYTAPNIEGDFVVIATSVSDPRASAEATVKVRKGTLPVIIE